MCNFWQSYTGWFTKSNPQRDQQNTGWVSQFCNQLLWSTLFVSLESTAPIRLGNWCAAFFPDLENEGPQRLWWTTKRPWQSARPPCCSWSYLAAPIPHSFPLAPYYRPLISLEGQIFPTFPVQWSLRVVRPLGRPRLRRLFPPLRGPPQQLTRALSRICFMKAVAGPTATNR